MNRTPHPLGARWRIHNWAPRSLAWVALHVLTAATWCGLRGEAPAVPLPDGVQAVWDVRKAQRETTPTRERLCLNGLWLWAPAEPRAEQVPADQWGYFKVPGCWPGLTDYMQKDCQTVYAHPSWKGQRLGSVTAAWYERQVTVPHEWADRRVTLRLDYLNSFAAVHVDGRKAGELHFPGGELDLTSICRPGRTHQLSLLVVALPLKGVMLSYTDSASAREVKGAVARRGLCGDVFLVSAPRGPRLIEVKIDTSVRRGEIACNAALDGLEPDAAYSLRARLFQDDSRFNDHTTGRSVRNAKAGGAVPLARPSVTLSHRRGDLPPDQQAVGRGEGASNPAELACAPFRGRDLQEGRFAFTAKWQPARLWDIHTPHHTCTLELSLLDAAGKVLDTTWLERFGFREFWIEGRDFYLNGTRLFLSALPLDNAQVGAAWATYAAARESLERLQSFGINCVYTHNYGCEPGSHLGFEEILRAADDVGMLVSLSQPHFSHYDWPNADADRTNGYARHAAFYVRVAQNHPSVVMYAMSHNATGYNDDMNPDLIDGLQDVRDTWALRNAERALRAEAIVRRLDPARVVYHHASGNLGSMHPINFYPNFVPVQELSDWFEHWATEGVKPVFTCEYGAPFTWDWTMYRGWYEGQREFGSAAVPWEFCLAEWNAQFFGDRAFELSEPEKANLRWEAQQFRAGKLWHRWDYPYEVGSPRFAERYPVFALYLNDNWRAFRTWGVSAVSPWEHGHFWKLREGVDQRRRDLPVDWENLQRPGFSPDFIAQRYERMDLAFERADWIATPAAEALLRNNRPLLAYWGGKPARFTSQDHNFRPGETLEKQMIVINNSRESVTCECQWTFDLPQAVTGTQRVNLAAGQQARLPWRCTLPGTLAAGRYELRAQFHFSNGEAQEDSLRLDVLPPLPSSVAAGVSPRPNTPTETAPIALFDPTGQTSGLLHGLGVRAQSVGADADLSAFDLLIVGKAALTPDGPAPDLRRVREGLKVVLFEQTAEVLERRLGFRVQEYGLRQVFPRVPDHPILAGLATNHLRDWRGEATILPPRLKPEMRPRHGPTVQWCGIPVTRLWRCGNRGNVASVLIEKPARGDFLPVLDGGFSLQYSPLLEYREGRGLVLFCQVDVTGRTEADPAAEVLARNLLRYALAWQPSPRRTAVYVGAPAGWNHLKGLGVSATTFNGAKLSPDQVLVVGRDGGATLAGSQAAVTDWLKAGGQLLALGLDQSELDGWLPFPVTVRKAEHIAACFEPAGRDTPLAGVSPAEVHNRDPRELPLIAEGARIIGNGVLAINDSPQVVFCQLEPWQFDPTKPSNLKRTFRRASFLVSRLLGNLGVESPTPLLDRFHCPVDTTKPEQRWREGFYLDQPEEWDDPYRFFRW